MNTALKLSVLEPTTCLTSQTTLAYDRVVVLNGASQLK